MTKEYAIGIISKYLNFNEICGTRNFKEAIETVLSTLKEKDNLINEQLKENVRLQKELNEENKRCMILANNDKFKEQIIDLMAERLRYDEDLKYEVCKDCEPIKEELCGEPKKTQFEPTELKCVKQYFEKLAKENKE